MTAAKRSIMLIIVIIALSALIIWVIWGNFSLALSKYSISGSKLSSSFDGYRIAHISDLHNAEIGDHNDKLLSVLRETQPDMIAITGDLIDSRNTKLSVALQFVEQAIAIAPCYYVAGNHEARIDEYDSLVVGLRELGCVVLDNDKLEVERNSDKLTVIGVNDPSFETSYLFGDSAAIMQNNLRPLKDDENFTLLLSHRPELMAVYAENSVDLVLSGHAHGGQFRLPFAGGVFAPNQGLFPEYDSGLFEMGNTKMVVSRGIGNSIIPLRFNNRPEVVLIELYSQN